MTGSGQETKPGLIPVLSWFAAIAGIAMFLSIVLALLDIGPSMMGGERVSRQQWLHIAAPLVAAIGVLMLTLAYALLTGRPWARPFALAIPLLIVSYAVATGCLHLISPAIMWRAVIEGSILGVVTVWYFYFKPNVISYFGRLSAPDP